jgi:nitrogenase subunit NifH
MNKTLVYVITWTGVTCVRAGGPPEPPGAAVAIDSCTLLNFIDANSGTVLYSVSGPNP